MSRVLAEARPIVIDTMSYTWLCRSRGAVGLKFAGLCSNVTDAAQDSLRSKPRSERCDGRNLALRLAALGYTHVYWYRGRGDAWDVAGLPETTLDMLEW